MSRPFLKSYQDNLSVIPEISSLVFYFSPLFILMNEWRALHPMGDLPIYGSTEWSINISFHFINRLGHTKCREDVDLTLPNKFHEWFLTGVNHWFCMSQYKALHWIQKAVRLDSMIPVYTGTKNSSSACDILLIFDQVTIHLYNNYRDYISVFARTFKL
jgi:hypothetical protein